MFIDIQNNTNVINVGQHLAKTSYRLTPQMNCFPNDRLLNFAQTDPHVRDDIKRVSLGSSGGS